MQYSPIFVLLLASCASPSLDFQGAPSATVTLQGDVITVFHTPSNAQAIRTNRRSKSERVNAAERLVQAIEIVTNCTVNQRTIRGDAVLMTADISCPS